MRGCFLRWTAWSTFTPIMIIKIMLLLVKPSDLYGLVLLLAGRCNVLRVVQWCRAYLYVAYQLVFTPLCVAPC